VVLTQVTDKLSVVVVVVAAAAAAAALHKT